MFLATGNNVTLKGDLALVKATVCRLESPEERPENKTFKDSNLLKTASARRTELLTAGFTVVRAYVQAKKPRSGRPPLGSFEEWSSWVRDLLLWLGEPDPVQTQDSLREERDTVHIALMDAWVELWVKGSRARSTRPWKRSRPQTEISVRSARPPWSRDGIENGVSEAAITQNVAARRLKGVFKELGLMSAENASTVALGRRFKLYADRVVGGRKFVREKRNNANVWKVVRVDQPISASSTAPSAAPPNGEFKNGPGND